MTHIENLSTILEYGLYSHHNQYKKRDISNTDVNKRRNKMEPVFHRNIHDYVPFYFNPRNAMMYAKKSEDIVVLGFDSNLLYEENTIFTDKNAATNDVHFFHGTLFLHMLPWDYILSDSWNMHNDKEAVKQAMMAEVLVYHHVDIDRLATIYVKDQRTKSNLMERYKLPSNKINIEPELFFVQNEPKLFCF